MKDRMWKMMLLLFILGNIVFIYIFYGNKEIGLDNYRFDKAIVYFANEKTEYDIKGWRDYDGDQLQITLHDGTIILAHSNNILLVKTK